jgi:hypothetical protein
VLNLEHVIREHRAELEVLQHVRGCVGGVCSGKTVKKSPTGGGQRASSRHSGEVGRCRLEQPPASAGGRSPERLHPAMVSAVPRDASGDLPALKRPSVCRGGTLGSAATAAPPHQHPPPG